MSTIITFIIVLAILVLVHELGHFFAARKSGMEVEEFGIGFPPRAISWVKNKTKYSLNWLPLGGFVKIKGEDGEDMSEGSFASKSLSKRLITLSAGILMNIALAWVLISIALMIGVPQAIAPNDSFGGDSHIVINQVVDNSPAAQAGFQPGDKVVSIEGEEINSIQELQNLTQQYAGQETTYTIVRGENQEQIKVTPRENPPEGEGSIGVGLIQVANVSYGFFKSIWKGFLLTFEYLWLTITGIIGLIGKLITGAKVGADVAGPVGIAVLTGQFMQMGIVALMQFTAILSINLAVINALPIPALDGGRILFLGIEAIRGRKVRAKVEGMSHAIGFALLMALMIFITIRDIAKHQGVFTDFFSKLKDLIL